MWRKFFKIFGFRVCQTQDFDREVRTRFLMKDAFGLYCSEILWDDVARLNPDGTVEHAEFITRWKEI